MDSTKFSALLKAVEYGSLTKAAEELGYTQAGLTHMMNRLEKEIGITLLQRTKSGVTLTQNGEVLLPLIKSFAQQGDTLENSIRQIKEGNEIPLRIATYSSIANHWLPAIINKFRKDFPNIHFEIRVGNFDDINNLVSTGEADLGFTSKQTNIHGDWIHLYNDPLYAVLPADFDIKTESADISIFNSKTFFMPTYGLDYDIINTLRKNNVNPVINKTELDDTAIVSMVSHGLGFSILPELVLKGMNGNFVAKQIKPESFRELGILVRSKSSISPVAHKFISYCKQVIN